MGIHRSFFMQTGASVDDVKNSRSARIATWQSPAPRGPAVNNPYAYKTRPTPEFLQDPEHDSLTTGRERNSSKVKICT